MAAGWPVGKLLIEAPLDSTSWSSSCQGQQQGWAKALEESFQALPDKISFLSSPYDAQELFDLSLGQPSRKVDEEFRIKLPSSDQARAK